MCCIKWRRTLRKSVSISPEALENLAQLNWNKGSWVIVSILAGDSSAAGSRAALWSVPLHAGLVADSPWKIVPAHQDYSNGDLQLEIRLRDTTAQLRLVNKSDGTTFSWVNVGILVLAQDDPFIQELQGTGTSGATDYYLPQDGSVGFDPSSLEADIAALETSIDQLTSYVAAEIARLEAQIDVERQARLAMLSKLNAMWEGRGGFYEPATNGDPTTPEILFAGGDVIMVWVPPA